MESSNNMNFKNFTTGMPLASGGRPPPLGNLSLDRQTSIYSLTFDEFQNTVGGIGKEFGSMNMDELLKNIWRAEENQNIDNYDIDCKNSGGSFEEGSGYSLLRQGSLALPRTLSQKTVDDVWRDMVKEYEEGGPTGGYGVVPTHRQPTLGEITLEEFLVRAGVVKEEPPKSENGVLFGPGFDTPSGGAGSGPVGARITESINSQMGPRLDTLPLGSNGARSTGFLAQPVIAQPEIRSGVIVVRDDGANEASVRVELPRVSSDRVTKSVSPVPYAFNGNGVCSRGRKPVVVVEKVVERRQKRMIKNRESAARSRARKQAYTTKLEAEVAKLKEENKILQKKMAERLEMHKKQVLEMREHEKGNKRKCLRRTQTGPW